MNYINHHDWTCFYGDGYGEWDHQWEFTDESFDHAYGTETMHSFTCIKCELERDVEMDDYQYDLGYELL